MPIRFRCEHCHQLLGIARRKASTRVECPTCHALVLVPNEDQEDPPSPAPAASSRPVLSGPEEPVFERSDFQELLQGPTAGEPSLQVPTVGRQQVGEVDPPARHGGVAEADFDVERIDHAPSPGQGGPEASGGVGGPNPPGGAVGAGYVLTPFRASLLVTVVIVLMAVSFVAGLLVGRYVL